MSAKTCPRCGCTEIDKDSATGGSYCTNCGSVLEENAIVAEVEFFETGTGGHGALGQFVSADAPSKLRIGSLPGVSSRESREVTLQRARRLIQEVASQLGGLNQHCKDTALNFVSMAVRSGLTRGRRSTHVIAACLYITCRLEGTPHLLLDFSDVLQVNVFELGIVFNFMARKLLIRLPQIDPCDYILRFAHCLDFGDKEHDVAMVALRLVQRMKRDWMAFGRRPTGLCGAALLLAARYHNFHRTVNDVIQVVNISDTVVRKRLEEFALTPSSELTLDEFQTVDLEQTCDPPAFREARNKAKSKQQQEALKSMEKEFLATVPVVEAALNANAKKRPYSRYGKIENEQSSSTAGGGDVDELEHAQQFVHEQLLSEIISDEVDHQQDETPAQRLRALRPTLESLGIGKNLCPSTSSSSQANPNEIVDDTLLTEDIDDDEIDSYLLNEDEVKMKEELWLANYEDFVVAAEEKRRVKEEERLKEEQEGGPKKKRNTVRKKKPTQPGEPASSANEAIEKMVQEKKLSNKINYDVLKSLTFDTSKMAESENAFQTDAAVVSKLDAPTPTPTPTSSRFKPYPIKKQLPETPATTATTTTATSERRFRIGARVAVAAAASTSQQKRPKAEEAATTAECGESNVTFIDIN